MIFSDGNAKTQKLERYPPDTTNISHPSRHFWWFSFVLSGICICSLEDIFLDPRKNAPPDGLSIMAKFPRLHEELFVLPYIVWRCGMSKTLHPHPKNNWNMEDGNEDGHEDELKGKLIIFFLGPTFLGEFSLGKPLLLMVRIDWGTQFWTWFKSRHHDGHAQVEGWLTSQVKSLCFSCFSGLYFILKNAKIMDRKEIDPISSSASFRFNNPQSKQQGCWYFHLHLHDFFFQINKTIQMIQYLYIWKKKAFGSWHLTFYDLKQNKFPSNLR